MSGLDDRGVVDGIESRMSSIAFNRAALSGLCEVLSSGKRIRLALSTRSLKASFSASDEKVIPSENLSLYLPINVIFTCMPGNYINSTKDTFNLTIGLCVF